MARSSVSVELYLDRASDPISGSIVYPDGRKLAFAGWIELTAALEEARRLEPLDVVAHGNESAGLAVSASLRMTRREDDAPQPGDAHQ